MKTTLENSCLDKNWTVNKLIKQIKDGKFIQTKDIELEDGLVDVLFDAKKYPITEVKIKGKPCSITAEFGTKNKDIGYKNNPCNYCECGIRFCVARVEDKVYLMGLLTYYIGDNNVMSCGLYLIPNGEIENVCFLGRYCHHNGTSEHVCSDGTVIPNNKLHLHKMTSDYYNKCKDNYEGVNLVLHLQSADAIIIDRKCENIAQLLDIAKEEFKLQEQNHLIISVEDSTQIADAIHEEILIYEQISDEGIEK